MLKKINIFIVFASFLSGCEQTEIYTKDTLTDCQMMSEFTQLQICANHGDAKSQYYLALRYADGIDAPKDLQKAFFWTEKAANQNLPEAQNSLGFLYQMGWGTEKNLDKAVEWTKKAADAGDALAINNMGTYYARGTGGEQNSKKAVEYYYKSLELYETKGEINPLILTNLSYAYLDGDGVPKNLDKALDYGLQAIAKGNPYAILNVSEAYRQLGKKKQAYLAVMETAQTGNPYAEAELAYLLAIGANGSVDKKEIEKWLGKALAQNSSHAFFVMGKLYSEKNSLLPYNEEKAYLNYLKAANMGHGSAQYQIGEWFRQGRFVTKNNEEAIKWYRAAVENSITSARNRLKEMSIQ